MEDFPSNSRTPPVQGEPKKIERVTSAEARPRKRGLGRRIREAFIGGDARTAGEYMLADVVVPAIQDTLIDAFQGGIERLIKGESARPRRGGIPSAYANPGHVNYQGMSRPPSTRPPSGSRPPTGRHSVARQSRARGDFADLLIPTRPDAETVLEVMYESLSRYGAVSVADLYEMTGVQSNHTDMKWGWYDLRGARVVPQRSGGYLLDLPAPEPLDQ